MDHFACAESLVLARVMERALMARRTLLAGAREWPSLEASVTLLSEEYHASYDDTAGTLSLVLQKEGVTLPVPQRFAASVFGTAGSHYIIPQAGKAPLKLLLAGDPARPEVVDLRNSTTPAEGSYSAPYIRLRQGERSLDIGISAGGMANSAARVYLPGGKMRTLSRLQGMLSHSRQPIVLGRQAAAMAADGLLSQPG